MARNTVPGGKTGFHEAAIKVSSFHKEQQLSGKVRHDLQQAAALEPSQCVVTSHDSEPSGAFSQNSWLLKTFSSSKRAFWDVAGVHDN